MKELEELFVPYPIALLAKEKGFDKPCLMYWNKNKNLTPSKGSVGYEKLKAPLCQQLIDWFRKKHNIHIKIDDFINDNKVEWDYEIVEVGTDVDEKGNYIPLVPYSTEDPEREGLSYYQALNKALEEAFQRYPK